MQSMVLTRPCYAASGTNKDPVIQLVYLQGPSNAVAGTYKDPVIQPVVLTRTLLYSWWY